MMTIETIDVTAQLIPAVWAMITLLSVSGLGIIAASLPRHLLKRSVDLKGRKAAAVPALALPVSA